VKGGGSQILAKTECAQDSGVIVCWRRILTAALETRHNWVTGRRARYRFAIGIGDTATRLSCVAESLTNTLVVGAQLETQKSEHEPIGKIISSPQARYHHRRCTIRREMPEDLKTFKAVFAERAGPKCRIVTQRLGAGSEPPPSRLSH